MVKKEEVKFVAWFSELSNKDVSIAGGKGASLTEMYNHKFPIPPGFIVTAQAYRYFLENAKIVEIIEKLLDGLNVENTKELEDVSAKVREIITDAKMPAEMQKSITEAYEILDVDKEKISHARGNALDILKNSHEMPFVAVRSSATTEDLADASFAGQQESFLNIKGEKMLVEKVKECFASLFTARAVYYRTKKNFNHLDANLAVVVQKMIDSEKSGVIFSKNPVADNDCIVLEAVFGLGEGIVSGAIKPDHYEVERKEMVVSDVQIAEKKTAFVKSSSGETKIVKLNTEKSEKQVLNEHEITELARYAKKLEEHYKKPQDIEFAISDGCIYIVQSRPITAFFEKKEHGIIGKVLLAGFGASPGVASGVVRVVHDLSELSKVKKGDVLVTVMTNPDMVVSMQKASAIVTDEGGITAHAAIVSREMGIPCTVGTGNATEKLKDGEIITVDGSAGKVYEGKHESKKIEIMPAVRTKLHLKTIVDLPEFAERAALTGLDSVGLVRLEGIIAESGKHPFYFTKGKNMDSYFDILVKGLKEIAKPFKEIWVRTSDLRSDEFEHLQGAPQEKESNPMLGDHGIRFSLKHKDIMRTEVKALIELAKKHPEKIFGIMVPQVISLSEIQETKKIADEIGHPKNVKIGMMVETPAAVQQIEEFCKLGINFISFGTNDLTQYTLAIDRNNTAVQNLYTEMHPAVLSSLRYVIRKCKKYGVETSICGQAGSKEEMAKFLLAEGIDSISVNADAAERVSKMIAGLESGK